MKHSQSHTSDQELLQRVVEGDSEAFGDLYIKYLDPIYRYVNFRLPSTEDAEDITEQIFLKAWSILQRGKAGLEIRNFKAWIYRVAHNLVIDFHRKKKPLSIDFQEQTGQITKSALDTEKQAQQVLDQEMVLSAMKKLDPQSQEVITLRFFQGLSHNEVSAILGLSSGHVRVLQYRALKQMKKILGEGKNE